jgi:predicted O-methyltransferase YrrM
MSNRFTSSVDAASIKTLQREPLKAFNEDEQCMFDVQALLQKFGINFVIETGSWAPCYTAKWFAENLTDKSAEVVTIEIDKDRFKRNEALIKDWVRPRKNQQIEKQFQLCCVHT